MHGYLTLRYQWLVVLIQDEEYHTDGAMPEIVSVLGHEVQALSNVALVVSHVADDTVCFSTFQLPVIYRTITSVDILLHSV